MRRLAICLILAEGALLPQAVPQAVAQAVPQAVAQAPKAELLWPKGAPGALGTAP
jgi:hypothetical protein